MHSQLSLFLLQEGGNPIISFAPWLIIIAIFYFILFRPQMKERKEQETMRQSLKKGVRVLTQGGLVGKVHQVKEREVILEMEGTTRVRVMKEAIIRQIDESQGNATAASGAATKEKGAAL